jgi:asparagine synthase (glutamine-hydrolysing)
MCGIAGQVLGDGRPVERATLVNMCRAQAYRGPDSHGVHISDGAGLGIQRLRVIDLESGDQPIFNEDRSIAVVLNGEIYNYRELRSELASRGHSFSSKSDTEVIAHLYEEEGIDCVRRLIGMFAFALWDEPRRRLFLARDRLGKKPLFYSIRNGGISFASELRALLADPEVSRDIDYQALDAYLTYQYVPAPLAAFKSIRKLPPASRLVFEQGGVTIDRYWRLRYDRPAPSQEPAELREALRVQIRTAVRRRLISDVPLGAFLSGGIDSATVVAAMAEASSVPVKTFSIGFEERDWNELPRARLVAERFSTDHRELILKPDLISILPRVARHYGEPFADSSAVPSFYVAEMARREVTVALNGDGGDENFAGYRRYSSGARVGGLAARLPRALRKAIGTLGRGDATVGGPARKSNRAARLARSLALDEAERYADVMSMFDARARRELYSPEFADAVAEAPAPRIVEAAWAETTGDSVVDKMLEVDVNTYLPDDLLVKADIASMAHSLEARSPLLDHELMEFAASIPARSKLHGSERKVVFRDSLRGWIPDQVLDGPKRGFALPMVGDWFRGELREYITEVLTDPITLGRGYFREEYVRRMLSRHLEGSAQYDGRLWTLMMLELWHREIVDPPGVSATA